VCVLSATAESTRQQEVLAAKPAQRVTSVTTSAQVAFNVVAVIMLGLGRLHAQFVMEVPHVLLVAPRLYAAMLAVTHLLHLVIALSVVRIPSLVSRAAKARANNVLRIKKLMLIVLAAFARKVSSQ